MTPIVRTICRAGALALVAFAFTPGPAAAAQEFAQKPEGYICPNATGSAVECFLEAVSHLYTMCRQVKSIEILEFGYEQAEQGTNGAKSEYCVDKHKATIRRHYQAALNAATRNKAAVETLRALHDYWQQSLAELKWHAPETDAEYKARVAKPYDVFRERSDTVRTAMTQPPAKPTVAKKPAPTKAAAATKSAN